MVVPAALRDFWTGPGRRPAWRRRVARKILAAVLAGCAAVVALGLLHPPPPEPRVDVVVAASPLPAGSVLRAGDLTTASVPRSLAASAGSAATRVDDVVGRVAAGALEAGEPVRGSRLLTAAALRGLGAGQVAVSVPLASPAVAAAVSVGSRLDVVVAGRLVASDVPVLAMTRPHNDGASSPESDIFGSTMGTVQALVAVRRADALALTSATGDPVSPAAPVVLLRGDPTGEDTS